MPIVTAQHSRKGKDAPASRPKDDLSPVETEVIAFFEGFAQLMGLSPSVSQIYGLLYCSEVPVGFEVIRRRLGISQGSTSQGLRYLQERGIIRVVAAPGARNKSFVAEMALGRVIQVLLQEQVSPRLAAGEKRLQKLEALGAQAGVSEEMANRLKRLGGWTGRAKEILPLVLKLAGGG